MTSRTPGLRTNAVRSALSATPLGGALIESGPDFHHNAHSSPAFVETRDRGRCGPFPRSRESKLCPERDRSTLFVSPGPAQGSYPRPVGERCSLHRPTPSSGSRTSGVVLTPCESCYAASILNAESLIESAP